MKKIIYALLVSSVLLSCKGGKTYGENEVIKIEDQEKYIVGDWELNGGFDEIPNNIEGEIEGEMSFMVGKKFDGQFGIRFKNSETDKLLFSVVCKGSGTWKWLENGKSDIDYEAPCPCDCKFKSYDSRFSVKEMKKNWICEDGKFFSEEEESDDKKTSKRKNDSSNKDNGSFSMSKIKFTLNKIEARHTDLEDGGGFNITLTRKGEFKN